MFFYYPLLIVSDIQEDAQGRSYHLTTPVAKADSLKDKDNKVVNNPAAIPVYGLKKVKTGAILKTIVQGRDGVYTNVDEASHAEVLECLELTDIKDIPLVHVREYESALDENGDEKKVRYGRKVKSRKGRGGSNTVDLSNQVTTIATETSTIEADEEAPV